MLFSALLLTTAAAPPPPTLACHGSGWGTGRQIEVHAAPSPGSRVLARLVPRSAVQGGVDISGTLPEFEIRGFRAGWFLIGGASYGDYGDPQPVHRLYAGEGWVRGEQISGQLYAGRLHAGPSQTSRSRAYGKGSDEVTVKRLLACEGNWMKIESDVGTGWVAGLCGNQVTTCN